MAKRQAVETTEEPVGPPPQWFREALEWAWAEDAAERARKEVPNQLFGAYINEDGDAV